MDFVISQSDLESFNKIQNDLDTILGQSVSIIQEIGKDLQDNKSETLINKKVDAFESYVNSIVE